MGDFWEASAQAMITMSEYLIERIRWILSIIGSIFTVFPIFAVRRSWELCRPLILPFMILRENIFMYRFTVCWAENAGIRCAFTTIQQDAQRKNWLANAIKGVEQGYTALGHLNRIWMSRERSHLKMEMPRCSIKRNTASQRFVRQLVRILTCVWNCTPPGDLVLLFSFLQNWNRIIQCFLEDPIRPDNFDEMGHVAQCRIPMQPGKGSTLIMNLKCF